jgi:hypothetical protein
MAIIVHEYSLVNELRSSELGRNSTINAFCAPTPIAIGNGLTAPDQPFRGPKTASIRCPL